MAINYAKLLAYKDEYEVARLYTDGRFENSSAISSTAISRSILILRRRYWAVAPTRWAAEKARVRGLDAARVQDARQPEGLRGTAFDIFGRSGTASSNAN